MKNLDFGRMIEALGHLNTVQLMVLVGVVFIVTTAVESMKNRRVMAKAQEAFYASMLASKREHNDVMKAVMKFQEEVVGRLVEMGQLQMDSARLKLDVYNSNLEAQKIQVELIKLEREGWLNGEGVPD